VSDHRATGSIHFEDDEGIRVAVATINCTCGHQATSRHDTNDDGTHAVDDAEQAAWTEMTNHLGYDPRDTPTGPENTSQTD